MTNPQALAQLFEQSDRRFFQQHPDRKAHIRKPYIGEHEEQFQTLGYHETDRRRILLARTDYEGKPLPQGKVMKISFLAFSDEDIADRDDILLPIIEQIMQDAKARISQ